MSCLHFSWPVDLTSDLVGALIWQNSMWLPAVCATAGIGCALQSTVEYYPVCVYSLHWYTSNYCPGFCEPKLALQMFQHCSLVSTSPGLERAVFAAGTAWNG